MIDSSGCSPINIKKDSALVNASSRLLLDDFDESNLLIGWCLDCKPPTCLSVKGPCKGTSFPICVVSEWIFVKTTSPL